MRRRSLSSFGQLGLSNWIPYLAEGLKALYKATLQNVLDVRESKACISDEEGAEHVIAASARVDWLTFLLDFRVGVEH